MLVAILLLTTACGTRIQNQTTETVKIYGNCGTCKNTIEKAGNVKNEATIEWNVDSKMASLSYDKQKTSKTEILKRIALAGYDSDSFLAPDDVYAKLPACCQYDRAKKTTVAVSDTTSDIVTNDPPVEPQEPVIDPQSSQILAVFDTYFALKDALVSTDGAAASAKAKKLLLSINNVKMESLTTDEHVAWMKVVADLKSDTKKIADAQDIAVQRKEFSALSTNMYSVMKVSKLAQTTYYQFCPMANDGKGANWLSKENEIKNPYYGSQMLTCGSTVETLKK